MDREPIFVRDRNKVRIGALLIRAERWPWQAGYNWHGMTNSAAPLNQPRRGDRAAPRFGGGWKYNLGIQFSGRTLLVELLFGMLTFNIETAKDRRVAAENAARRKAEIDRILNRGAA
ncbi:hypothetical protein [Sphingobium sp. Z007]|uniref:hypothetical protein n=1 Tax=Sphingobium sp. Z007 TaxID=627495 RepID=UPI000B4971B8|nr:hypothetical protein [Sphingobium sp. Z007]